MKKRQITLMTLGILIVILSMVGVSYSYYTANIKEINKTDTVVKTDKLTLTYTGTKEIEVYNLIPGSSYQKTFKVYNDSTKAVTYNIYMEQIINDFECGFNYSIEYEGKKLIEKSQLPATNTNKEYLVYEMHIGAKETQNFTMTINYENLGYNQNIDKGAEFIGTLGIDTIQFKITKPNGNYTALINSAIANECGSKTENDCESGECKKELIPTICEDNTCIKKEEIVVLEKEEEVEKEGEIQKEVAIAHDIYYSDETKYKNGENKRYVTYCTEYQKDNKKYVKYCTKEGQSGKCKIVETTNNCSYKTAMKDLGRTSFQYQSFRENFADTGNGNWHVQTYCSTKQIGIKTDYETGIYYCSAKQNLHDWYILNEQGASGKICKRATELHTQICNQTDSQYYCSGAGYSQGDTITYGNLGTKGVLASGDAFDCDVNGDGVYDAETERFYYVSDYYNTNTKNFEDDTAILILYATLNANGNPDWTGSLDTIIAYDIIGTSWYGPRTAWQNLPTISEWSNVRLKNEIRTILNEKGENTTKEGTLPTDFSYRGRAARLLTLQEIKRACPNAGSTMVSGSYVYGEIDNCNYLMENTSFNDSSGRSYWLENPLSGDYRYALSINASMRNILSNNVNANYGPGVRPVIEVAKSDLEL